MSPESFLKRHNQSLILLIPLFFSFLLLHGCGGGGSSDPAPELVQPTAVLTPSDGSTISGTTGIHFDFNTSMNTSTLSLGGSMAANANSTWSDGTSTNDTLVLNPVGTWTAGDRTLTVNIDSAAGVAMAPVSLDYTVNSILPVAGVNPTIGSNINGSQSIVITFNESMDSATLAASGTLWSNSDSGTWSNGYTTLTLAPTTSWPSGAIALTLDIDDPVGHAIATFNTNYSVDNTPATPTPTPANNGSLFDDFDIVIRFSESMNTGSVVLGGTLASNTGTGSWSQTTVSNDTLTLSPTSKWSAGSQGITVAVDDLVGNSTLLSLAYTVIATTDSDGDGFSSSVDCDDAVATTYPGAPELCDGVDNNCAAGIDETCSCVHGTTQSCYTGPNGTLGIGICAAGLQTCSAGVWGSCAGDQTPLNEASFCSNFLDDDCDALIDSNDPDCPILSPSGAACAVGSTCQSGVCLMGGVCQ